MASNKTPKFLLFGTFDGFHLDHLYPISTILKVARVLEKKGEVYLAVTRDEDAKKYKENLVFTAEERRTLLTRIPLIQEIFIDDIDNELKNTPLHLDYLCLGESSYEAKKKLVKLARKKGTKVLFICDVYKNVTPKIYLYGKEYIKSENIFTNEEIKNTHESSSKIKTKYGFNKQILTIKTEECLKGAIQYSDVIHQYLMQKIRSEETLTEIEKTWMKSLNKWSEVNREEPENYNPILKSKELIFSDSLRELKEFYYSKDDK